MVHLIKKGGLRERANRSRSYQGSENTETTLHVRHYRKNTSHDSEQDHPVNKNEQMNDHDDSAEPH